MSARRAELVELVFGDPPEPWVELGLRPIDGVAVLGGVRLRFSGEGGGLLRWALHGASSLDLEGLATEHGEPAPAVNPTTNPLTAIGVDHVVALTDDLARTTRTLVAAGLDLRRTGEGRAFFVLGPALLELVEHGGEVAFWGLTLVVRDLGRPGKDAVQPGRRIATVGAEAGLGLPVALMTPRA